MNTKTVEKINKLIKNSKHSDSNKIISEYVIKNIDKINKLKINDLANATNTSTTSIIRFCKQIEFSGFKEFKFTLLTELQNVKKDYNDENNAFEIESEFYEIEKNISYFKSINDKFNNIAKLLISSDNNFIFAFGGNINMSKVLHNYLVRLQINSVYLEDRDDQLAYSYNINEESTCIFISYKFRDSRWKKIFNNANKSKGSKVIITSNLADLSGLDIDSNTFIIEIPYNEGEKFNRQHSEASFLIAFTTIIKKIINMDKYLLDSLIIQDNN
ncbi:MurR/RpiR family transcriptional regulator [Mesoplasma florum]|uniref:MurR/RpiR family transcriptional regulator n=1 Tax=Mesoplasma florum TaxID=2151 RepID=UPI001319DEFE|nr:MurR/RpiR family transcriptional regulator [Mesoplasma florum]